MFRDDECSDEGNDRSIRLENLISDLKSFAVKFVHGGVLILSDIGRLMDFARHKIDSSLSEPKFRSLERRRRRGSCDVNLNFEKQWILISLK